MKKYCLVLFVWAMLIISHSKTFSQKWIQKQSYPDTLGADGGICFSINNKIYVGGGMNSKLFKEYDPASNIWTDKANIPGVIKNRYFGISFSINGKGYVGLGLDTSNSKNDLWEYDPIYNSWTQKQNFPGLARTGLFNFVINNIAYVGAGEDPFSLVSYDSTYAYNPSTDTWATMSNFPLSDVTYPFSFSIGNKGYVSCGLQSGSANSTYEYNPLTNTWTNKADYPGAIRAAGVSFVINNTVYCGLGLHLLNFYNDFFAYDPITDTWTAADSLPAAKRAHPIAGVVNNVAYAGLGWSYMSSSNYYQDWWQFSTPSGINNIQDDKSIISIFPNPASQRIHVSQKNQQQLSYKVINVSGEIIKSGMLSGTNNAIDVSAFSKGMYFINFLNDEFSETQLFIKN